VSPEDIQLYEPGLAAHMMDVAGHDYRCAPQPYLSGRPMPEWPAHRSLVGAIPMAIFAVQSQREDEARITAAWAASFCGGLRFDDIMESDRYLK
jgi:hypothetical protein